MKNYKIVNEKIVETEELFFSTKEAAEQYLKNLKPRWEIYQTKENKHFIWTKYEKETFGHQDNINVFYCNLGAIRESDMIENLKKENWEIYSIKNQNRDILKIEDYIECKKTNVIGKIIKIEREGITIDSLKIIDLVDIKILSSNDLELYLDSLKPKFKVGDIVVIVNREHGFTTYYPKFEELNFKNKTINYVFDNGTIGKCFGITEHDNMVYKQKIALAVENGEKQCLIAAEGVRLANSEEILKYYEKQGWVKGVRFKHKKNLYSVSSVYGHTVQGDLLSTTINVKSGYVSTLIEECELIKEPDYLKTWGELNCTDTNNLLFCIKNLINLYGKEKFKQEWDL